MSETQHSVQIAELAVKVEHLEAAMADLLAELKLIRAEQWQIGKTLAEAKGGYRTLLMIGGAAASVGAGAAWILDHIVWR